jgi:hypothetical protein
MSPWPVEILVSLSFSTPLPPEAEAALAHTTGIAMQDFSMYFLLNRPVMLERGVVGVFDPATASITHWNWNLTSSAPWTTEPGKHLVGSHMAFMTDEMAEVGGREAAYARLQARSEELYPGLLDAGEERATQEHRHHWMSPLSVGPKWPRRAESVKGLWFVGDGSAPSAGIWTEAAASAGILGARAIVSAGEGS